MIQNNINYRKTVCCFAMLFMVLLGFSLKAVAQEAQAFKLNPLAAYTLQAENSTYIPLSGGTTVSSINADDAASGALPIGFTFSMGCNDYTSFYASSNGMICFKRAVSSTTPALGNGAVLAPLWADLSGAGTGSFSYKTTGAAPNRVLTAEWKNWKWNYNATSAVISFQVKIYESTNTVEYIYNQEATPISAGSNYQVAIGL
jgi:hypothetical protein